MNEQHITDFRIDLGAGEQIRGTLECPEHARALIVFVSGNGCCRYSTPHNRIAQAFVERDFATLLMDLLTTCEDQRDAITRELRFDISLLAKRLTETLDSLANRAELAHLPIGLLGSGAGAAAALVVAAKQPARIGAVVCRGGRPDLAGQALAMVRAPTLLIVGSEDTAVLELNRSALHRMSAPGELAVIEGATHEFEEPGALDQVSGLAADWFSSQLVHSPAGPEALEAPRARESPGENRPR